MTEVRQLIRKIENLEELVRELEERIEKLEWDVDVAFDQISKLENRLRKSGLTEGSKQ